MVLICYYVQHSTMLDKKRDRNGGEKTTTVSTCQKRGITVVQ
jgi:hypothetical protein